ncbi:MAG: TraR/DksA family transcriptional regulator [Actinomycetota bacterium]
MAKTQKSRKNLDAVEEKLNLEREHLLRQVTELEARQSGETPTDAYDDEGEPETATYERERDLSLLENARDLLDRVDRALGRIADGTYGTCESCGRSIEAARLKALPYATLCISCKREEERR